jgi:hypothetical protein
VSKIKQLVVLWALVLTTAVALASHSPQPIQKGNAVTQWNSIALQVLPSDPGLLADSRAYAIMHAAIHDAVNGGERRYQPYTANLSSPGASVDAAVAAAAHDTLVALSPSQQAAVKSHTPPLLAEFLTDLPR